MTDTPVDDQGSLFDPAADTAPWDAKDWGLADAKARQLFKPTQPVNEDRLFSGRISEIVDLLTVIYEGGAHAIIHGERGVGKSSLVNIIEDRIPDAVSNIKILKENCLRGDDFLSIWSKILFDFEYDGTSIQEILRNDTRHFIVTKILETLPKQTQYVFVFDEFDRIENINTKVAIADTIKYFSDYPQNVTILIVGVGFSVEELFGAHPSIERCCRQIPMPRMSNKELVQIIDDRLPHIGFSISDSVKSEIINVSQGFPGFVHLVTREAILSAIRRRSRRIDMSDYSAAINESVRIAHESLVQKYNKAIYSAKANIYKEVLLACAMARRDNMGKFSATDVKVPLSQILERPVEISNFARHLAAFCDDGRGAILRKTGKPKRFQYQFVDAPLQPYIVMVGKKEGLI